MWMKGLVEAGRCRILLSLNTWRSLDRPNQIVPRTSLTSLPGQGRHRLTNYGLPYNGFCITSMKNDWTGVSSLHQHVVNQWLGPRKVGVTRPAAPDQTPHSMRVE